jgi:hypothetical protein
MAKAPVKASNVKAKKGDTEKKGKTQSGTKVTAIGKSRNTRKNSKNAVRERKGR